MIATNKPEDVVLNFGDIIPVDREQVDGGDTITEPSTEFEDVVEHKDIPNNNKEVPFPSRTNKKTDKASSPSRTYKISDKPSKKGHKDKSGGRQGRSRSPRDKNPPRSRGGSRGGSHGSPRRFAIGPRSLSPHQLRSSSVSRMVDKKRGRNNRALNRTKSRSLSPPQNRNNLQTSLHNNNVRSEKEKSQHNLEAEQEKSYSTLMKKEEEGESSEKHSWDVNASISSHQRINPEEIAAGARKVNAARAARAGRRIDPAAVAAAANRVNVARAARQRAGRVPPRRSSSVGDGRGRKTHKHPELHRTKSRSSSPPQNRRNLLLVQGRGHSGRHLLASQGQNSGRTLVVEGGDQNRRDSLAEQGKSDSLSRLIKLLKEEKRPKESSISKQHTDPLRVSPKIDPEAIAAAAKRANRRRENAHLEGRYNRSHSPRNDRTKQPMEKAHSDNSLIVSSCVVQRREDRKARRQQRERQPRTSPTTTFGDRRPLAARNRRNRTQSVVLQALLLAEEGPESDGDDLSETLSVMSDTALHSVASQESHGINPDAMPVHMSTHKAKRAFAKMSRQSPKRLNDKAQEAKSAFKGTVKGMLKGIKINKPTPLTFKPPEFKPFHG